jgi:hypothetical protein
VVPTTGPEKTTHIPVVKLSLVLPNPIPGHRHDPPPLPIVIDGNQEYEVEEILDSHMRYNYLEYLIKSKAMM